VNFYIYFLTQSSKSRLSLETDPLATVTNSPTKGGTSTRRSTGVKPLTRAASSPGTRSRDGNEGECKVQWRPEREKRVDHCQSSHSRRHCGRLSTASKLFASRQLLSTRQKGDAPFPAHSPGKLLHPPAAVRSCMTQRPRRCVKQFSIWSLESVTGSKRLCSSFNFFSSSKNCWS